MTDCQTPIVSVKTEFAITVAAYLQTGIQIGNTAELLLVDLVIIRGDSLLQICLVNAPVMYDFHDV